jgi:hypothetical protein
MDGRKKRTNLKMNIIGWSVVWRSNAEVGHGGLKIMIFTKISRLRGPYLAF